MDRTRSSIHKQLHVMRQNKNLNSDIRLNTSGLRSKESGDRKKRDGFEEDCKEICPKRFPAAIKFIDCPKSLKLGPAVMIVRCKHH